MHSPTHVRSPTHEPESLHLALNRLLACADRMMPRMRPPCPRPPNGADPKLHGQGPRAEADAARRLPACEARDAGGVTPSRLR